MTIARSFSAGLLITLLLLFSRLVLADVRPLSGQLKASGAPVYTHLAQANHIFGFSFQVRNNGFIRKLGGRFSGIKTVIVVNEADEVVASATVFGKGSRFVWSALDTPLAVSAGQSYRVLTRVGVDQTSSAAWSVNMPFTRGAIRVTSLQWPVILIR